MDNKLKQHTSGVEAFRNNKEFTKYISEMIDEMKRLRLAIEKLCNKMEKK